jgi:aspartate kinase
MIVMKFGGTSVEDAAALRNVREIVTERRDLRPLVVVSACAGVTNDLLGASRRAAAGDIEGALAIVGRLRERHIATAEALLGSGASAAAREVSRNCADLSELLRSVAVLRELTPRTIDQCAAYGEAWSSLLLAEALTESGVRAERVDSRQVMITDDRFTQATPLLDVIEENARGIILPKLAEGIIVVTQGFVGSTKNGRTTTIGRGGSDYSAAILGAALRVEEIQIWTDVDGILTADPSVVPEAQRIEEMSFAEASELAYFGAKVLHPSTILPAVESDIPVRVLNSRKPQVPGTRITRQSGLSGDCIVRSIAYKKGITVFNIQSTRMLMGYGFLARIFEIFARHEKSIDVVATSEVGVSLTVDDASGIEEILAQLRAIADVRVDQGKAVLCVVGENMKQTKGMAGRIFNALSRAGVNIELISHGGSEINLTFVIDEARIGEAVRALHDDLFPTSRAPAL